MTEIQLALDSEEDTEDLLMICRKRARQMKAFLQLGTKLEIHLRRTILGIKTSLIPLKPLSMQRSFSIECFARLCEPFCSQE